MYAFRNAHPAHRGYLLIGLSVRCVVTEQAIFDACCENPDSGKILGSRSIGTPRKQSLHTHRPRIEERDLVYIDGMSFLHLIVDVLICIHELLRNLERVLEAFLHLVQGKAGPLFKRAFNSWNGYRAVLGNGNPRYQERSQ